MDSQGGWRWQLRPDAQPVSYLDPSSGQWVSGSFDTAVKSEHGAVRSSGVQPQATAGQVPQLPSQTIHQLQSDVNRHEQAELRRQESGAAPQPMPTAVYQAPPPTDSDEADGGYRRQRDRQLQHLRINNQPTNLQGGVNQRTYGCNPADGVPPASGAHMGTAAASPNAYEAQRCTAISCPAGGRSGA